MYVYTIKDFGSSRFTECSAITIHITVFHFITNHEHQKKAITASEKYAFFVPFKFLIRDGVTVDDKGIDPCLQLS